MTNRLADKIQFLLSQDGGTEIFTMKFSRIILTLFCAMILTAGCSAPSGGKPADAADNGSSNMTANAPSDAKNSEEKEEVKLIKASELPDISSGWTEVNRYTGDVNGDGTDENVVLMAEAERDASNNIMWNDGQKWLLYVEDRYMTYVLFNEYVQLGNVYFEVADYYTADGAEPNINVIKSTGSELDIRNYTFDSKNNAFAEKTVYDTKNVTKDGINRRYSSVPEIK